MSKGVVRMAISLDDVRLEFEQMNKHLDDGVSVWVDFQKPILTNYETTKRMFAPNNQWDWVIKAYRKWVNSTVEKLNEIATKYGFEFVDDGVSRKTFTFKCADLDTIIDESLGELRLYYNYDIDGGNRNLEALLENVATIKFSLTRDDIHRDEVLEATFDLCRNVRLNEHKSFRTFEMVMVQREFKNLLSRNVARCAADMRPIYQRDFEYIMGELESFRKYDDATELVDKILRATFNGNFDLWYDKTVNDGGSVDVIHDMEIEMQNLASELGLDVWFI